MGKDSLAMWLYLRDKGFKIIPYFLWWVPDLSYVKKSLEYYEDFFKTEIYLAPHPLFVTMLRTWAFQPPHSITTINRFPLPQEYDFSTVDDFLASHFKIDPLPFCAIGMRSSDNLERRRLIQQQGPLGIKKRRYYYAVHDWGVDRVAKIIVDSKCKLPPDYKHWGRTITAYHYYYLEKMKTAYPQDYEKILQWFPLLEAEFFRYEQMRCHEHGLEDSETDN